MRVLLPSSTLPAVARRSRSFDSSEARKSSILNCSSSTSTLKIPFALLHFHRAFAVVVDHPVFALRIPHRDQLGDDFRNRIGIRPDSSRAGRAAERTHEAADSFHGALRNKIKFRQGQRISAHQHAALLGVVKRNDRNVLKMDVLPHVHLRPVGKRKTPDALPRVQPARKKIPKFGALILRVPLAERIAERENAFLSPGFFLVATGSSESRIELSGPQGVEKSLRLQQ